MFRVVGVTVGGSAATIGGVMAFYHYENEHWKVKADYGVRVPTENRPKVVVLGTGWGALSFLQRIDTEKFDVVCVSPRNYFLFTPLLPSATVGTVEHRSISIPIREILAYYNRPWIQRIASLVRGYLPPPVRFCESICTDIDITNKRVHCEDISSIVSEDSSAFSLDYDYLVVAVGAQNNTFNTPGVYEHCHFLKTTTDAIDIRNHVMDLLETASITDEANKKDLLQFVVVGGGPTGVEFAAELQDFLEQDLSRLYPRETSKAKVSLIQSTDHILNTYDLQISLFTEQFFRESNINVLTNTRVIEIRPGVVEILPKSTKQKTDIPFSMCIWATGIAPVPLVERLMKNIPGQGGARALLTDEFLRVVGDKALFAVGDCANITQGKLFKEAKKLFRIYDANGDGQLSPDELSKILDDIVRREPSLAVHTSKANTILEAFDKDKSGTLDETEFDELLRSLDRKLKSLPATAQVANQQGLYLANLLNNSAESIDGSREFVYKHKGELAYVGGDRACASLGQGSVVLTGAAAGMLWHAAYLDMIYAIGLKSAVLVSFDWIKKWAFGRDTSRV